MNGGRRRGIRVLDFGVGVKYEERRDLLGIFCVEIIGDDK